MGVILDYSAGLFLTLLFMPESPHDTTPESEYPEHDHEHGEEEHAHEHVPGEGVVATQR